MRGQWVLGTIHRYVPFVLDRHSTVHEKEIMSTQFAEISPSPSPDLFDDHALAKMRAIVARSPQSEQSSSSIEPSLARYNKARHPQSPLRLLIATAKWWPAPARLAAALRDAGATVSVLCPDRHPLTVVDGLERTYTYQGPRSLACLRNALASSDPDFVIPTDDGVVAQLQSIYGSQPERRALLERSLGPAASLTVGTSRARLMELAGQLALPHPKTVRIQDEKDLERWFETVAPTGVLKLAGKTGGNGVRICRDLPAARRAWAAFTTPVSRLTPWKQWLVDRDPLALWQAQSGPPLEITMQAHIAGTPANAMALAVEGELIDTIAVEVVASDGETGAAKIVRRIDNAAMISAARKIADALRLSGFFGLDFVLESATRTPYLIEMNPRCTQIGHLPLAGSRSLAELFVQTFAGRSRSSSVPPPNSDWIGLFPAAVTTLREHPEWQTRTWVDRPTADEPLAIELLRGPWSQRRWLTRVYHGLRPPRRVSTFVHLTETSVHS